MATLPKPLASEWTRFTLATAVILCVALAIPAGSSRSAASQSGGTLVIETLSSRPDFVSGGDALVEIRTRAKTLPDAVLIKANERDVSRVFRRDPVRGSLVGLVEGLRVGRNTITVEAGGSSARLEVTNFPVTGPIVSGEHLTPFECRTVESGLGPPLDADCSAPTKVEYFYKSTDPVPPPPAPAVLAPPPGIGFKPLDDPAGPRPSDLASATTNEGKTVPYIVRVESGTINRAIYRIAVLDNPNSAVEPREWRPGPAWNHRLIFSFGGGCGATYNQGAIAVQPVLFDAALARGFAHATSTQNVLGRHCNDHLSGEALMMLKEHIIERYGVLTWTMGHGGSGGAIQQFLIAQNFPGLLDGLVPTNSFPDSVSVNAGVTDCRLLINYYQRDPATWTEEKQIAVEGYSAGTCAAWDRSFVNIIVADNAPGCGVAPALVYDATNNPKGARCTVWDTNVASYGRNPATGFARSPLDNVGLQYGLLALNRGAITKAEFIDLNEKIGGFDHDGHVRPARTVADPEGLRLAYATGRLGAMIGLDVLPILQIRSYLDPAGDIHSRERDFTVRDRLRKAGGHTETQVLWTFPANPTRTPGTTFAGGNTSAAGLILDTMSQWLDALARDTSTTPAAARVARAKPASAADACWDANLTKITEPAALDGSGKCNQLYPTHLTPRLVAGAPLADDVLKCQLKPIDPKDYRVTFTPEELQTLRRVFPDGVCDYSKPGVNQQRPAGTYSTLPLR